jgi:hypothetical protein
MDRTRKLGVEYNPEHFNPPNGHEIVRALLEETDLTSLTLVYLLSDQ